MNIPKSKLEAVDLHRLVRLSAGDPVARYGPFVGLTFVSRENGHVTLRDKHGNEKRVYESLFLKHGFIEPSAKAMASPPLTPTDTDMSENDHTAPPPVKEKASERLTSRDLLADLLEFSMDCQNLDTLLTDGCYHGFGNARKCPNEGCSEAAVVRA